MKRHEMQTLGSLELPPRRPCPRKCGTLPIAFVRSKLISLLQGYTSRRSVSLCTTLQRSRFKIHMKLSLQPLPHLPANSCKASPCKTHTAWQCRGGVCWQPFWKLLQHLDIKNGLERLLNMVMGDWNLAKQRLHVKSDAGYAGNVTKTYQHIQTQVHNRSGDF